MRDVRAVSRIIDCYRSEFDVQKFADDSGYTEAQQKGY